MKLNNQHSFKKNVKRKKRKKIKKSRKNNLKRKKIFGGTSNAAKAAMPHTPTKNLGNEGSTGTNTEDEDKKKELIKIITDTGTPFTNIKKSLSIVYKLEDILNDDNKQKLIKKYTDYQKSHADFSKYGVQSDVSVIKLFKMSENDADFTHILISRNFSETYNLEDTLKILIS